MRRKGAIIGATLILLHVGDTAAQTHVPNKYPDPRCSLPEFEVLPQTEDSKTSDKMKASLYDYEVRQYNREVEAYSACLRNYIATADRDMQRIQAQANNDVKRIVDNANAFIALIQAHVRKATANEKKYAKPMRAGSSGDKTP